MPDLPGLYGARRLVLAMSHCGGWIGVDLDGTLAEYQGWNNGQIGRPVPAMLQKVRSLMASGAEVRIFTARVSGDDAAFVSEQRLLVETWCKEHLGRVVPVTATKDFQMVELWDDRARQVIENTGFFLEEAQAAAATVRMVR